MAAFVFVRNLSRASSQSARVRICNTFASRLRGLMFRSELPRDEGLMLVGGRDARLDSAIHMLFVPFDLAVFWISGSMEVVDRVLARAWHLAYIPTRPASYVLELHPELFSSYDVGNKVEFIDD